MAKKKINIKPLADRVVVKMMSEEEMKPKSVAGIILPDSVTGEKPQEGTVVAVGTGRVSDSGETLPMSVKVGDRVLVSKYISDEVEIDGDTYAVVREDTILAILG